MTFYTQAEGYSLGLCIHTFEYSYDNRGNITRITKNGSEIQSYVYDSLNQLTRENNAETNQTVVFSYDNHGNILNKKTYAYTLDADLSGKTCQTIYYGYDNVWTDLLIRYKGQTITYDRIGNPLKYRDGFSFSWSGGRKLTTVNLNNGSVYMTGEYRYDDNGIRTYKEVNGNITRYYLDGSTILTEETNYGGVSRRIDYIYDEAGSIFGFYVDGKAYYYQKNLQGDVTGILDANGVLLVEYIYDAYGVPTTRFTGITDSLSDAEKHEIYVLGSNNPFRYRGYYYDTETGFYYLNSRYYDPQTGRFLNADGYASTGQGVLSQNMFAYCLNNPVNYADPTGNSSIRIASLSDWIKKNIVQPIVNFVQQCFTVKYDVPLYNQRYTSLCWAFCQTMIEDYHSGINRTQDEAFERGKEIAVKKYGPVNWNRESMLDNAVGAEAYTLFGTLMALKKHGPLLATYGLYKNGVREHGHGVVITGVDYFNKVVYTNNPSGKYGEQSYDEFLCIFAGGSEEGWKLEGIYYLDI